MAKTRQIPTRISRAFDHVRKASSSGEKQKLKCNDGARLTIDCSAPKWINGKLCYPCRLECDNSELPRLIGQDSTTALLAGKRMDITIESTIPTVVVRKSRHDIVFTHRQSAPELNKQ